MLLFLLLQGGEPSVLGPYCTGTVRLVLQVRSDNCLMPHMISYLYFPSANLIKLLSARFWHFNLVTEWKSTKIRIPMLGLHQLIRSE